MPKKVLSAEDCAVVVEQIAALVAKGELPFDIVVSISNIDLFLINRRNKNGLLLLNRISQLTLAKDAQTPSRYEMLDRLRAELAPLDPIEDSKALRALAAEIRAAG